MVVGTLIAESLKVDSSLEGFDLLIQRIHRVAARLSPEQIAAGLPDRWTMIDFEIKNHRAGDLAKALSEILEPRGWYVNFQSESETFVVFPGRIFQYPRGDTKRREEAQAFGRRLGIPELQLDWTV